MQNYNTFMTEMRMADAGKGPQGGNTTGQNAAPVVANDKPADAPVVQTAPVIVASAIVADDRSLEVRFCPANKSVNPKAPVFRCLMSLPGALAQIVTEIPIFKSDQGQYSAALPGGRFPSMRAANRIVQSGGKDWETTIPETEGAAKIDALPSLVLTAFHAYLTTGEAKQRITFS